MDIRAILIPFDFSDHAERAVSAALNLAEKWHSRLLLLYVVPAPSYPPMVMGTYFNYGIFVHLDRDQNMIDLRHEGTSKNRPVSGKKYARGLAGLLLQSVDLYSQLREESTAKLAKVRKSS